MLLVVRKCKAYALHKAASALRSDPNSCNWQMLLMVRERGHERCWVDRIRALNLRELGSSFLKSQWRIYADIEVHAKPRFLGLG